MLEDLTGSTFNRLKVIGEPYRERRRTYYPCECTCGQSVKARADSLLTGKIKSCGCVRVGNISNKTFGKLTVLSLAYIKKGAAFFNCKCSCGVLKVIRGTSIKRGKIKSCGCKVNSSKELRDKGLQKCYKCKNVFTFDNFHKKGKVLHTACKLCRKYLTQKYQAAHREKLNLRKKLQYADKPKLLSELRKKAKRSYEQNNPEKVKARIEFVVFFRKFPHLKTCCVVCGNSKSEGHHPDYTKPLEVIWLCRPHHRAWHRLFKTLP